MCAGGWAGRRVGRVSVRACGRGGGALGWAGLAVTRRLGRPGDSDRAAGRPVGGPWAVGHAGRVRRARSCTGTGTYEGDTLRLLELEGDTVMALERRYRYGTWNKIPLCLLKGGYVMPGY